MSSKRQRRKNKHFSNRVTLVAKAQRTAQERIDRVVNRLNENQPFSVFALANAVGGELLDAAVAREILRRAQPDAALGPPIFPDSTSWEHWAVDALVHVNEGMQRYDHPDPDKTVEVETVGSLNFNIDPETGSVALASDVGLSPEELNEALESGGIEEVLRRVTWSAEGNPRPPLAERGYFTPEPDRPRRGVLNVDEFIAQEGQPRVKKGQEALFEQLRREANAEPSATRMHLPVRVRPAHEGAPAEIEVTGWDEIIDVKAAARYLLENKPTVPTAPYIHDSMPIHIRVKSTRKSA